MQAHVCRSQACSAALTWGAQDTPLGEHHRVWVGLNMGIRGLTSWIHACPSAFSEAVSIEPGALVLLDAMGCAFDCLAAVQAAQRAEFGSRCACEAPCSCAETAVRCLWDCGGGWNQYVKLVQSRVGRLLEAAGPSGRVVAFIDGGTPKEKLDTWRSRTSASAAVTRKLSTTLHFHEGPASALELWAAAELQVQKPGRLEAGTSRPPALGTAFAHACAAVGAEVVQCQGEADDGIGAFLSGLQGTHCAPILVSNDSDLLVHAGTLASGARVVPPSALHTLTQPLSALCPERIFAVMQLPPHAAPALAVMCGCDTYTAPPELAAAFPALGKPRGGGGRRKRGRGPASTGMDGILAALRLLAAASPSAGHLATALVQAVQTALAASPCPCGQCSGAAAAAPSGPKRRRPGARKSSATAPSRTACGWRDSAVQQLQQALATAGGAFGYEAEEATPCQDMLVTWHSVPFAVGAEEVYLSALQALPSVPGTAHAASLPGGRVAQWTAQPSDTPTASTWSSQLQAPYAEEVERVLRIFAEAPDLGSSTPWDALLHPRPPRTWLALAMAAGMQQHAWSAGAATAPRGEAVLAAMESTVQGVVSGLGSSEAE